MTGCSVGGLRGRNPWQGSILLHLKYDEGNRNHAAGMVRCSLPIVHVDDPQALSSVEVGDVGDEGAGEEQLLIDFWGVILVGVGV